MITPPNERVRKHSDDLRAATMQSVEIGVPDTGHDDFALECKRQSRLLHDDPQELDAAEWAQACKDTLGWE